MTEQTKIIMKINAKDKEKFKTASERLSLTLSGFMKMSASEKANKILSQEELENYHFLKNQFGEKAI